eukprot:gene18441-20290_t
MPPAIFVRSKGTWRVHAYRKRQSCRKDVNQVSPHASPTDHDSSWYEGEFDFNPISVNMLQQESPCEVFAPVTFIHQDPQCAFTVKGKVDTGTMVSCMPMPMLANFGLSKDDIKTNNAVIRVGSGANLKNYRTVDVKVACNNITAKTTLLFTKCECALILGLEFCKNFQLVSIAPICIQQSISNDPDHVEAVHITDKSEVNYNELRSKWKEHLPLGRTYHLGDLKQIFPDTFDGQVGMFDGEVSLELVPDAKPVQLPPRAVPQSIMPKPKKELGAMKQEGIIRPCRDATKWVHNLVIVLRKMGHYPSVWTQEI